VIRDKEFRGVGGAPVNVEALLKKVDAAAERFDGLDRVCFYAHLAELVRKRCGEMRDSDAMLKRATDDTEQERNASRRPPASCEPALRVTSGVDARRGRTTRNLR
jgi:hypothetical protein